jgi:L-fuconolactonase
MELLTMRIDSHQHFWKYNATDYVWMTEAHDILRRDFLPADIHPLLDDAGLDGTIAVQARQMVEETDFLLSLAESDPRILGVVGWLPLADPGIPALLEAYAHRKPIVGLRHVVHDEPDPDFILRPDVNRGVGALAAYPLCYDILIFERHLPQAIRFADLHLDIRLVVDHIAKPVIRRGVFDQAWADNIRRLAERPHVCCKLSGMLTEVRDATWDLPLLQPYFDTVLEAFGADRIMLGSDWPVCLLGGSYRQWMEAVASFIAPLSGSERKAILGGTAARTYLQREA